jgi:hypothetical protein
MKITETTTLRDLDDALRALELEIVATRIDEHGYRQVTLEDVDGNRGYSIGATLAEAIAGALAEYIAKAYKATGARMTP